MGFLGAKIRPGRSGKNGERIGLRDSADRNVRDVPMDQRAHQGTRRLFNQSEQCSATDQSLLFASSPFPPRHLKGNELDRQANQYTPLDWGPSLDARRVHCGLVTLYQLFASVHDLDRIDYRVKHETDL